VASHISRCLRHHTPANPGHVTRPAPLPGNIRHDLRHCHRLFPDFAAPLAPDAARLWEMKAAAPLVPAGPKPAAARQMVMKRTEMPFEARGIGFTNRLIEVSAE
jgi:hypothetical protein